ncbi:MAG: hypothetical protein WC867_04975 [Candidatus Pacearchaeota archaeon]|jgi:hypothetical protein
MTSIEILPIKIKNLILKGKVDSAYKRMYDVAESLAAHETKKMLEILADDTKKKYPKDEKPGDYIWNYSREVLKYRQKRIQHHINEMKELLILSNQLKEK